MTVIISPWVRRGNETSIMTAKVNSNNELILECGVPSSTGEQSCPVQIHHGAGVKSLSDRAKFSP